MKSTYVYRSLLVVLLFVSGCSIMDFKDAKLPSWSIELEMPLTEQVVDLGSMLEDSLITTIPVDSSGDSIFIYSDSFPIDRVEVGDQLNIDDINKSFSQSVDDVSIDDTQITQSVGFDEVGVDPITKTVISQIGLIELDNIDPTATDPFRLDQVYPDIIAQSDGMVDSIPSFNLTPVIKPFTFNDFDEAVFTGGTLDIKIVNDMIINLGVPINIQLQQASGIDTVDIAGALATFNDPIFAGDSATASIDLTGMTLPGNIFVKVSGNSSGSDGNSVLINDDARASSFVTKISAGSLQVNSAVAVVPSQTIDEIGFIDLAEDSNKVEQAIIATGNLAISVENGLSVSGDLVLTISSLETPGGASFQQTIPLTPNSNSSDAWSIKDHTLIMTLASQQVEYSYQVVTKATDPAKVEITETDSVHVDIDMYGPLSGDQIIFSQFQGMITPQKELITGDMDMESDSEILEAQMSAGTLAIEITNNFNQSVTGVPEITITLPELFDPSGDTLVIGPQSLEPGINTISTDLADHLLKMARSDQRMHYRAEVVTDYGEIGNYNLLDSIFVDIAIADLTFDEVTGYFTQDAMVDSSTIALDSETLVQEAEINAGELVLTMVNHIGVEADINFTIEEFYRGSNSLDTVLTLNATGSPQEHIVPLNGYVMQLSMADQSVHYVSRIAIPSTTEMTLSLNDSIDIQVDIRDMGFAAITGVIDPVTVEIDTINQEVSALPDEFDGIDFANVNMIMEFETNIGVPVFLDLSITASNTDGEVIATGVSGWDITDSNRVRIPDAQNLINIKPESIVAFGTATVGGGIASGTVAADQYIQGNFVIEAPLELILTDDAQVEMDPEEVDTEKFPQELERLVLYARYDSEFDFGTLIEVLAAHDTTHFLEGSTTLPDTLFVLEIEPNVVGGLDSVYLDEEQFDLFDGEQELFLKTTVDLFSREEGDTLKFLSTDSLKLLIYGSAQVLVDPEAEDEEGN